MRWLKFIFDQYIDDTSEPVKSNFHNPNANPNPKIGDVYMLGTQQGILYYVIADTDEYPYEVYIASPYWELASHKDLILDGREKRWVVLSIPRYATDGIIGASLRMDQLTPEDVRIMKRHIHLGEVLPNSMTGLSYQEGENSYQEMFRNREIERSRILLAEVFREQEDIEKEL